MSVEVRIADALDRQALKEFYSREGLDFQALSSRLTPSASGMAKETMFIVGVTSKMVVAALRLDIGQDPSLGKVGFVQHFEIEDELESYRIMNDERRIIQVLLNLIMNAIKYTFNGKVRLKVSQLNVYSKIGSIDVERLYIVFSVVDTGQGISEDKQDNLFKLFGNLDVTDYCQSTSIGLGLTVSKKIVDYMDG